MRKREFLQLANTYDPEKHGIGGWYASEKLDGMRAYWDGGVSRGILTSQIKYANTDKDYRRITPPRATGLWTRYGKPIAAPEWWLDQLPTDMPLDGELYLGRGRFQELVSIVKKLTPGLEWENVVYHIFDSPSDYMMFSPGKINNPIWRNFEMPDCIDDFNPKRPGPAPFRRIEAALASVQMSSNLVFHKQEKLPITTDKAILRIDELLDEVTNNGGEGLILRNPDSIWTPSRNNNLLKVKKFLDSEARIIGYVWGKGKLEGLMGSLIVTWNKKTFELSGFTEAERVLHFTDGTGQAYGEPGTEAAGCIVNPYFPKDTYVTFRYRELTMAGIPKEARYWRVGNVC